MDDLLVEMKKCYSLLKIAQKDPDFKKFGLGKGGKHQQLIKRMEALIPHSGNLSLMMNRGFDASTLVQIAMQKALNTQLSPEMKVIHDNLDKELS